ncbi:MAG: glycosyltransferase [Curvibacter sp.]|nr:MAG: glycosyltransferase [Curvibacter sp.]
MKIISLVIPIFNEAAAIPALFKYLKELSLQLVPKYRLEAVFVDDGSSDRSVELLYRYLPDGVCCRVVELSRNFGKEAALTAGLDHATGDAVIPIDADLQDPPLLVLKMIQAWEKGAEVVLAKRARRSTDSYLKRESANWFYKVHNLLSSQKIPENVGDFRLMDRVVVDALQSVRERNRFMKGIFSWVGFRSVTVDYERAERSAGTTKFSGWKLWNLALEGLTSFSTVPLRLWTYLGLLGALAALIVAADIVIKFVFHGADVPGYSSLMVAIVFFGSAQFISLGVIGEYLGRLYIESKQRPLYVVRPPRQQPSPYPAEESATSATDTEALTAFPPEPRFTTRRST